MNIMIKYNNMLYVQKIKVSMKKINKDLDKTVKAIFYFTYDAELFF